MFRHGLFAAIGYMLGYKLTPIGRSLVLIMFISAIGSVTVELPIYQVFCFLSGLLFCTEVAGILMQPRLETSAWIPGSVTAGEPLHGTATITNRGRWPAYDVMCALYKLPASMRHINGDEMIPVIPAGATATLRFSIQTTRRGLYELPPLRPHSTFPFNVMRFGRTTIPLPPVNVLPSFHPLEALRLPATSRYQPGGVLIAGRVGSSAEYIGNREYSYGEPVHRLDFKAWARLGKPVVREYQDEYCTRITVILDTHLPTAWPWQQQSPLRLEAAISLTAMLADALKSTEAIIDLFAAGPELYVFRTTTQSMHFQKVLEILAGIESTNRNPFEELSPALSAELESISSVLCIFMNWDRTHAAFVQTVRDAGCEVRILFISDIRNTIEPAPDDDELFRRLAPSDILSGKVTEL